MGVTAGRHRFRTPVGLALVVALAGATGSGWHSTSAGEVSSPSAGAGAEPPASVTRIVALPYPAGTRLPAPVRIAATSVTGQGPPVQVNIVGVLLSAYRSAVAHSPASCHLPVSLLAAIGQVESGSLVGARLDARHRTSILGPLLDGQHGFKAVADTDQGRWDGNARWDRAVGPMQFIPGTWSRYAVDGDGDGVADPQDVEDATATAAAYLCAGGRDLAQPATMRAAVLAYNASDAYARLVLTYQQRYASLGLDRGGAVTGLSTVVAGFGGPTVGSPTGAPVVQPAIAPSTAASRRAAHTLRHSAAAAARTRQPGGGTTGSTTSRTSSGSPSPVSAPAGPGPTTRATDPSSTPTPSGSPSPTSQPTADPTSCPSVPTPTATPTATPTGGPSPDAPATCPPCGADGSPTPSATPSAVTGGATATPTCLPADPSATATSPSAAP